MRYLELTMHDTETNRRVSKRLICEDLFRRINPVDGITEVADELWNSLNRPEKRYAIGIDASSFYWGPIPDLNEALACPAIRDGDVLMELTPESKVLYRWTQGKWEPR